jgi:hypothetical protein
MSKEVKNKETKTRAEKYNHSAFPINGTFDQVIKAAFVKDKKPPKEVK